MQEKNSHVVHIIQATEIQTYITGNAVVMLILIELCQNNRDCYEQHPPLLPPSELGLPAWPSWSLITSEWVDFLLVFLRPFLSSASG